MTLTIKLLAACVLMLLLLGALALDSAAVSQATPNRFYAHLVSITVGLAGAAAFALIPYRRLQGWSGRSDRWPRGLGWLAEIRLPSLLLGLAILQLGLLFVPGLSEIRNGARRWPIWGGQPSEFAKLALILALADYLARNPLPPGAGLRYLLRPAAYAGAVALLILVEPDWGGAAVTGFVAAALLLLGGARWFHLLSAAIILGLVGVHGLLADPHRLGRVMSFSDPEACQFGPGFQQWRSVLAIASGGWTGRLPGEGRFTSGYVPEQETDFVFSLVAEESGFVGVTVILLLYATVLGCGWRLASRTRDPFGQYLAAGITLWIMLQALIHIGVNTSSLPNKGLPLPFVSYGGSNLMCLLAGFGLLVSVGRHAPLAPQPDPSLCRASLWSLIARRLWRLVRGQDARPARHAYQLPPKPSHDPRRALALLRAATRSSAAAWSQPPAWERSSAFGPTSNTVAC